MDEFPSWAQEWMRAEPQKVSHCLNLALKLRNPYELPLMLWDVVVARPKIQRALGELSFVHFARFVPSWDGTALMVITEFDGPLEPYVMDFAIAIGDVFDRLLSYVKDAPPLPVSKHPDEFWTYVQLWNRVPFFPRVPNDATLFPPDFDYPLFCAYPDKTVIDITGPRGKGKLPQPALDRPAAWVDLNDVQGNILRGYGAKTALHQFFTVTDAATARQWLAEVFSKSSPSNNLWGDLTTAEPWGQDDELKTNKPDLMANVAFTFAGMTALLPGRLVDLNKRFPLAFREGAEARAKLNGDIDPSDPSDPGPSAPGHWHFGRDDQHIHVVLTLQTFANEQSGGVGWTRFVAAVDTLKTAAEANGLQRVYGHETQARKGEFDEVTQAHQVEMVYFDYRDGITDPRISGQCPARPADVQPADFQPAASPGEFLLGPDYCDIYGGPSLGKMPGDLALNGSFAAMRLMEQHVDTFNKTLTTESARLGIGREGLKAKLMGRWTGGEPLALEHADPPQGGSRDNFDYAPSWEHPEVADDHAGKFCPVGAHIRRTNPRNARVAGQRHARRLIRRGMPTHWQEDGVAKKGLLGLFIGGSLERQFEFIQQQWIQGDLAASGIRGTQDPIAGLRSKPTEFLVWPDRPDQKAKVPPLVTTRGSLYLFSPGIRALQALDSANSKTFDDAAPTLAVVTAVLAKPAIATTTAKVKKAVGGFTDIFEDAAKVAVGAAERAVDAAASAYGESTSVIKSLSDLAVQGSPDDPHWLDSVKSMLRADSLLLGLPDEIIDLLAGLSGRVLNSEWVRKLVETFAPPPCAACESPVQGVPTADIDPADPWVIANPCAAYAALQTKFGNLVWVPAHRAYWVLDLATAQDMFNRPSDFVQQASNVGLRGIITLDGNRHTVVRAAVVQSLAIAASRDKVDHYLDAAMTNALNKIGRLPQFDFVASYGSPVPGQVFWDILGLPPEHREECGDLAQTMMRHFGQPEGRGMGDRVVFADASLRLTRRLALLFAQALAASLHPAQSPFRGTLIGEIASRTQLLFPSANRTMHFDESLLTLVQFVLAGFMSMQFLMGTGMRNLLTPDPRADRNGQTPWQQLRALYNPGNPAFDTALRNALAESRRVDPPVTIVQRYAGLNGAKIGNVTIPKDCPIFAVVASAHRDPTFIPEPGQFHWDRNPQLNLSLGHGTHECVGRLLQDWVVPAALTHLLEAMPDLRLCDTESVPAWLDNLYFRSLQSLPVSRCYPAV